MIGISDGGGRGGGEDFGDDGEGIVEFVGDAGDHLAQAGKLFGLAQLLLETAAVGDFAEEELEGLLPLEINAGAFDLGEGGAAVFLQDAEGALGAQAVDPFDGVALGLVRARGGLAEGGEKLGPRLALAEAERYLPDLITRLAVSFKSRMRRSPAAVMMMASPAWLNNLR